MIHRLCIWFLEVLEKYHLKKVPLAATTDSDKFKINDAAEVTVMIYRGKPVKADYALAKGDLDQKTIRWPTGHRWPQCSLRTGAKGERHDATRH